VAGNFNNFQIHLVDPIVCSCSAQHGVGTTHIADEQPSVLRFVIEDAQSQSARNIFSEADLGQKHAARFQTLLVRADFKHCPLKADRSAPKKSQRINSKLFVERNSVPPFLSGTFLAA
jgi:hypothetical protein